MDVIKALTTTLPVTARQKLRRWPARLDLLQSATGLALVSFLVFMALLAVAFVYLWRDGALEWR